MFDSHLISLSNCTGSEVVVLISTCHAYQIFSYQDIASGITALWQKLWVTDTGWEKISRKLFLYKDTVQKLNYV